MNPSSEFLIDPRTEGDLRARLLQLAASYTPEWVPDEADPDIGLTAGLIFTSQMAGNLRRLNQVVEKYHTEFVNMLNLSLLPAFPAEGVAVLELIQDTVPGIDVPAGTRLLAGAEDGEDLIFETRDDVHITNSRLREVWAISGSRGRILPYLGEPVCPSLYPGEAAEVRPAAEELRPFRLFDFQGRGVERNALLLYHRSAFDAAEGVELLLRLGFQGEDLSPRLADPAAYRWSWYGKEELIPFEQAESRDGLLVLKRSGEGGRIRLKDGEYAMLCLEALEPVTEPLLLDDIAFSSICGQVPPSYVANGTEELDPAGCRIFGTRISLLDECYIGLDPVFRQQGAEITLGFRLSCEDHLASLSPMQEEAELKVIKRKPRSVQVETASTAPQRITLEYFNGTGWRQLPGTEEWASLFDGTHEGAYQIVFTCPEDWEPVVVGGYDQRALRIKVVQADNCYFQPCIHRVPRLEGITLSYHFQGSWKPPQRISRLSGAALTDQSGLPAPGRPLEAFAPIEWSGDGLCLGFDRPMSGGPVSILFDLREDTCVQPVPLQLEYSTRDGFRPLKAIDHTRGMTRAGTIQFLPPPDFARREVAGRSRFWLRLMDKRERPGGTGPVLRAILPNAVEIRNQETLPELSFTIEASAPNMVFSLGAENILSAEVFVNERDRLTVGAMQRMLRERPEDVRAEYDFLGDIQSFFVRWTEVDNFDSSHPGDRHYTIDRMAGTLRFGDGLSVMIPPASRGTSLTVSVVRCDGARANLKPGAVHDTFSRLLYIDRVSNPIATYGGSSIESVESARLRGAALLSGRGRLVSEQDFLREIRAFSGAVSKARCVPGQDPEGKQDSRAVSVVLMMRDYAGGSYSFNSLQERLLARLTERCEAALSPERIYLTEPAYVELTVDLWVELRDSSRVFAVQSILREGISAFLDPLTGCGGRGWAIGVLPTELQIRQHIQSIRCGGTVLQYIVTARYRDREGVHERDLSTLPRTPFMIGVNGNHQIHPVSGPGPRGGAPC